MFFSECEGETELDGLKNAFGRFLHFLTYSSFDKEYTYMESVTGREYDILEDVLRITRENPSATNKIEALLRELEMEDTDN